jgi:hypothetical protein
MENDRFDFEQQLISCWSIIDEIKLLNQNVLEGKVDGGKLTNDEISNYLLGLSTIYDFKFNKLWDLFESVFMKLVRDEKMAREECAALREQLEQAQYKPILKGKRSV